MASRMQNLVFLRKWVGVWWRILFSLKPCKLAAISTRSESFAAMILQALLTDRCFKLDKISPRFSDSNVTIKNQKALLCHTGLQLTLSTIAKSHGDRNTQAWGRKSTVFINYQSTMISHLQLTQENHRPQN